MADIAGVIEVHSHEFTGSISLYFTKETFLKLMEIMLGNSYQEINEEIESGAGELLNMIFGQATSFNGGRSAL